MELRSIVKSNPPLTLEGSELSQLLSRMTCDSGTGDSTRLVHHGFKGTILVGGISYPVAVWHLKVPADNMLLTIAVAGRQINFIESDR